MRRQGCFRRDRQICDCSSSLSPLVARLKVGVERVTQWGLFLRRGVQLSPFPGLLLGSAVVWLPWPRARIVRYAWSDKPGSYIHVQMMIYLHRVKHQGVLQTLRGVSAPLTTTNALWYLMNDGNATCTCTSFPYESSDMSISE